MQQIESQHMSDKNAYFQPLCIEIIPSLVRMSGEAMCQLPLSKMSLTPSKKNLPLTFIHHTIYKGLSRALTSLKKVSKYLGTVQFTRQTSCPHFIDTTTETKKITDLPPLTPLFGGGFQI